MNLKVQQVYVLRCTPRPHLLVLGSLLLAKLYIFFPQTLKYRPDCLLALFVVAVFVAFNKLRLFVLSINKLQCV